MVEFKKVLFGTLATFAVYALAASEKPCAARQIKGESVVCVCNATYCDQINRIEPGVNQYIVYTSTKKGDRFKVTSGFLLNSSNDKGTETLNFNTFKKFQRIEGFGGAVTDSAGINWKNLSEPLQKFLIESYFSKKGIEYNMIRVPIGGSDFSTHAYAYNMLPLNDKFLTNFSLSEEDYLYKIPMIKESIEASPHIIHIVATTWSPPVWMKTNNEYSGSSRLITEYFQTYADYHVKFLEKYAAEGIKVWGVTTTNEPLNGIVPLASFNSLGWETESMAKWIIENLGPTIHNSNFSDTMILALDDQRYMLPLFFEKMVTQNSSVLNFIDGIAVHYYGDNISPQRYLSDTAKKYPDKFILATEACEGSFPWEFKKTIPGSWKRAENYMKDIIEDLQNSVVGWIDWNLCLNTEGGPNWVKNYVDSPILVTSQDEFIKQPMFYAMGHFSKFVPRGSRLIEVSNKKWFSKFKYLGFLTPSNTVVVIVYNGSHKNNLQIIVNGNAVTLEVPEQSFTTIEMKLPSDS